MTETVPSLFGRVTAIQGEHARLHLTLNRLLAMCAALERRWTLVTDIEPEVLTRDLSAALSAHFHSEESDDYFGTIVTEHPHLLRDIDRLKAEHVRMLDAAANLTALAVGKHWAELVAETRRLVAELKTHEVAETALMHEFLLQPA